MCANTIDLKLMELSACRFDVEALIQWASVWGLGRPWVQSLKGGTQYSIAGEVIV